MRFCFFIAFCFFLSACGAEFMKLASEAGTYFTQNYRDMEEMRKRASDCDYEKDCFEEELSHFMEEVCIEEKYNQRGFISEKECKRQYPYVFLKVFEAGKYTSTDAIEMDDEMREALREYDEELERYNKAKEDYEEAREEWREAQRYDNDDDYEDAKEHWKEAQDDYEEAREDYEEAWDKYEEAKRKYKVFYQ